jgi:flagellar capping protein FliD
VKTMVGVQNSWRSFGNVHSYATNLVKNYLKDNPVSSGSTVSNFLNNAFGTTQKTVQSNKVFTTQNTTNLKMLQSTASSLSGAARSLGTGQSQLVTSDEKVVKAEGTYYSKGDLSFDVSVQNIAESQKSVSAGLESSADSAFDVGKNSIAIQTEKGRYDVEFEVGSDDTNLDSLNKLAESINSSKAGVTAKVVNADGKSSLQVTSDGTGVVNAFEIGGQGSGNAAGKLSMSVEREAADANYTVDGKSYSSSDNTVSVPNGRGAKMTLVGEGSAKLEKGVDASKLVSAAQDFADAYNRTVSHLMSGGADGAGVTRALNLVADNRMTQMSMGNYGSYAAARLSSMGISIDGEGLMQVDAEKLTNAVKESPSSVQSALSGYGSVTEATRDNAAKAMNIPAATYTNFSNMGVQNSLISALMPKAGSMFDFSL